MTDRDYRNPHLSCSERAEILASRMTTVEKCWQLVSVSPWSLMRIDGSDPEGLDELLAKAPGHICNFGVDDPAQLAEIVRHLQRGAVERTRLGIPLLIQAEALNGFMAGGHTVFPTPIGLAASWSPDLVEDMADTLRSQMVRTGVRQALSPVMDVALDPRWGRVHETYGEDPYLVAALAVAYTSGLQGSDPARGVIATAKHFLAYGLPQGGINLAGVDVGSRALRDVFAFPFEAAIQVAGLRSVMNSYSDIDGVPVGASREVLTELLRTTLGFDGFVTSDYTTLQHLIERQAVARDAAEAGRLTIAAGLDVENPSPFGYGDVLAAEIERGTVDREHLEVSVRRVLRAKFESGLFENPYPAERIDVRQVASEGRELSAELARRSVVLASNTGLLPLPERAQRVAVIGSHADAVKLQFPTYTFPAFRDMFLFMSSGGFGNMIGVDPGMVAWNEAVLDADASENALRERYDATSLADAVAQYAGEISTVSGFSLTGDLDDEELARAVAAAREADVVILALGGASLWFLGDRTEGEASDTADIALPEAQSRLAEAVAATGTPMVVVLVQGRAYSLPPVVRDAAAVVIASYGGPYGCRGVADVLFGRVNPSGKLPYSVPRHCGQVPVYHHQRAGSGYRAPLPPGVEGHYLDMPATPLYAFGHGLSYTSFLLSDLETPDEITTASHATIAATISNTGAREGATVVQLYLRANSSAVTRPAQQLAGFARIELAPGQSKRLSFTVDATQLGYTNLAREFAVEPSRVDVFVGLDSDDKQVQSSFEVVGPTRTLTSRERVFFSDVTVGDA